MSTGDRCADPPVPPRRPDTAALLLRQRPAVPRHGAGVLELTDVRPVVPPAGCRQATGIELAGEQDVVGTRWDGRTWSEASWDGRTWSGST